MQFCVARVILRDLAALVPQIFHSLHKITHFLTGYINSYSLSIIYLSCSCVVFRKFENPISQSTNYILFICLGTLVYEYSKVEYYLAQMKSVNM
jgi:hypothetical protein